MRITTALKVTRTTERLVRVSGRTMVDEVEREELVVLVGEVVEHGEEEPTIDVLEPRDLEPTKRTDAEERLWFAFLEQQNSPAASRLTETTEG